MKYVFLIALCAFLGVSIFKNISAIYQQIKLKRALKNLTEGEKNINECDVNSHSDN